jgi:hypothetical protein
MATPPFTSLHPAQSSQIIWPDITRLEDVVPFALFGSVPCIE